MSKEEMSLYYEETTDGYRRLTYKEVVEGLQRDIEELNKENEKLKKGLNKLLQLNNYMINFSSKKAISKLLVKQWDLIYELLEGRPRGIMHGSKGADKE